MAMVHETVGSRYLAEVLGLLPWEPPVPKRGERFGRAAARLRPVSLPIGTSGRTSPCVRWRS